MASIVRIPSDGWWRALGRAARVARMLRARVLPAGGTRAAGRVAHLAEADVCGIRNAVRPGAVRAARVAARLSEPRAGVRRRRRSMDRRVAQHEESSDD